MSQSAAIFLAFRSARESCAGRKWDVIIAELLCESINGIQAKQQALAAERETGMHLTCDRECSKA